MQGTNGISATNTPDVLTADVADMGVGLLLAVARRILRAEAYVCKGGLVEGQHASSDPRQWQDGRCRWYAPCRRGRRQAPRRVRLRHRLSMSTGGWICPVVADLVELARRSEFFIVTLAGRKSTKGMVNARVLDALGPEGILVNISRGAVVDELAFIHALGHR